VREDQHVPPDPDDVYRTLEQLAAACEPAASRPLTEDSPVGRLRQRVADEDQALLDEVLAYVEERGKLTGAATAYRHTQRLLRPERETSAPVIDLAAVRAQQQPPVDES
jgi:hypothetical protein